MTWPRVSAIVAERARRRLAGTGLLLLVAIMPAGAPLAQDQADPYSTTVKVDATADSAAAARDLARIDGQRRALAAVVAGLSGSTDGAPLAKLSDKSITDMVVSFEVANERMSAVRYLADYTFHFRPSKVRRLIPEAQTPPAEGAAAPAAVDNGARPVAPSAPAKPAVLLPIYQDGGASVLWDDPNPWREAWAHRPAGAGPVPLSLPLGDAGDVAAIDAAQAASGSADALAAIAQRNGGDEAVVAQATARRNGDELAGLDVSLKRYRLGRLVDSRSQAVDANPGESAGDLIRRAVDIAAADLEARPPPSDQPASLAAIVPIASLGEWVQVRDRLASVPSIRKVALLSLTRQEARIEIRYVGGPDQLKSALAGLDLDLAGGAPVWRLLPPGAARAR